MFDIAAYRRWDARARAESVERGAVVATLGESCPTCWHPMPDPTNVHRRSHTKGVTLCQCPDMWSHERDQLAESHGLDPRLADMEVVDDFSRSD